MPTFSSSIFRYIIFLCVSIVIFTSSPLVRGYQHKQLPAFTPIGYLFLLDTYIDVNALARKQTISLGDSKNIFISFEVSRLDAEATSILHDFIKVTPSSLKDNVLLRNTMSKQGCIGVCFDLVSIDNPLIRVCLNKIIPELYVEPRPPHPADSRATITPISNSTSLRRLLESVSNSRNKGAIDGISTVDVVERMAIEDKIWPAVSGSLGTERHKELSSLLTRFVSTLRDYEVGLDLTEYNRKRAQLVHDLSNALISDNLQSSEVLYEWLVTTRGEGCSIGLFDSGVSLLHEGFHRVEDQDQQIGVLPPFSIGDDGGAIEYCKSFIGRNSRDGSHREVADLEGTEGCHDGFGHGTFVAGVVGSNGVAVKPRVGNFNIRAGGRKRGDRGVQNDFNDESFRSLSKRMPRKCRGIAPGARLHVFKTFTDQQVSYTSYFLAALNAALQLPSLDIINLSMGGYDYEDHPFVEKALELSAAGKVIVTAGGNDGPHWGTQYNPADQLDVIAVGAVNKDHRLARFSSRGMTTWELPFGVGRPKPDVLAYGDPIAGASLRSGACRSLSGTSMASPVVAGVLALVTSTLQKRLVLCDACSDPYPFDFCKNRSISQQHCHSLKRSGPRNVALMKQVLFASSTPLFPLRYSQSPIGQAGLSPYTVLEHSIFAQGAGLIDAPKAIEFAAMDALPKLTAFPANLFLFAHPTSLIINNDARQPLDTEATASECQYMWPWCAQPIFFTGMPLKVNVTLLNSVSRVARRSACYALLRHSGVMAKYISISVDCSERLWPHVGTATISFAVMRPFEEGSGPRKGFWFSRADRFRNFYHVAGQANSSALQNNCNRSDYIVTMETTEFIVVEGTVEIHYEAPGDQDPSLHVSIPFRIKVLKQPPPRSKRLLWDVGHSVQFPFSYIPRDSLDKGTAGDFLDWNGDHPHTNYAAMLVHLTSVKGYYVDILASPRGLMETFSANGMPTTLLYPNHVRKPALKDLQRQRRASGDQNGKLNVNPLLRTAGEWEAIFGHTVTSQEGLNYTKSSFSTADNLRGQKSSQHANCDYSTIASRYGALLLADTEDFYTPKEIASLHNMLMGNSWISANAHCNYITNESSIENGPVATPTFGLVLLSEWYNCPLLSRLGGTDDNTGRYWEPLVGGANVPALNELLAPYHIQLSHLIVDGDMLPDDEILVKDHFGHLPSSVGQAEEEPTSVTPPQHHDGVNPLIKSGGTIQMVPTSSNCQWCTGNQLGVDTRSLPPNLEPVADASHATLLFTKVSRVGRIAIYTDSHCMDMAHHPYYPHEKNVDEGQEAAVFDVGMEKYLASFCFGTLDAMLAFTLRLVEDNSSQLEARGVLDLRKPTHHFRGALQPQALLQSGLQCFSCLPKVAVNSTDLTYNITTKVQHSLPRFDLLDNSTFSVPSDVDDASLDAPTFVCPLSVSGKTPRQCLSLVPYYKPATNKPYHFTASDLTNHLREALVKMQQTSWTARRRLGVAEMDGDDDWDRHRMHRQAEVEANFDKLSNQKKEDSYRNLLLSEGNDIEGLPQGQRQLPIVYDEHYEEDERKNVKNAHGAAAQNEVLQTTEEASQLLNPTPKYSAGNALRDEIRIMRRDMDPLLKRPSVGGSNNTTDRSNGAKIATNVNYSRYLVISTSNPLLPILMILWVAKWVLTYKLMFNRHTKARIFGLLTRLRLIPVIKRLRLLWVMKRLGLLPPFGEAHEPEQEA